MTFNMDTISLLAKGEYDLVNKVTGTVKCELKGKEKKKNHDPRRENARHGGLSRQMIVTINLCQRR